MAEAGNSAVIVYIEGIAADAPLCSIDVQLFQG